jgi:hypothetical protein
LISQTGVLGSGAAAIELFARALSLSEQRGRQSLRGKIALPGRGFHHFSFLDLLLLHVHSDIENFIWC